MESSEAPGSSGGSPAPEGQSGSSDSTFQAAPVASPSPAFPTWIRVVPFFLSAFLFLSGVFAVFAPLPLLLLALQSNRYWTLLAVLTNALLVQTLGGPGSFGLYGIFVLALAVSMPEFLKKGRKLEWVATLTLLSMVLVAALAGAIYAQIHHTPVITAITAKISLGVDYLMQSLSNETRTNVMEGLDQEEWKRSFLTELPSAVAIFALVLVWANLLLVLRLNPKKIREQIGLDATFFRRWKAPEFLVWPALISGFFLIKDLGLASDVALNVFKFLMAVYAIQGLSILSFLFDVWNIRGVFRSLGFMLVVFLMLPLLLSIGFFDLWFDFRSKFRQS